jgi:hypothetical protein
MLPDADERSELLYRLARIEAVLDSLVRAQENHSEWIDSEAFCKQVGIAPKQLTYYMSKGTPGGDVVRNIGTVTRPRYRFHRVKAVDQFLNRSPHNRGIRTCSSPPSSLWRS